jgi:hypothetical protein
MTLLLIPSQNFWELTLSELFNRQSEPPAEQLLAPPLEAFCLLDVPVGYPSLAIQAVVFPDAVSQAVSTADQNLLGLSLTRVGRQIVSVIRQSLRQNTYMTAYQKTDRFPPNSKTVQLCLNLLLS